jgi:hypothetical protein
MLKANPFNKSEKPKRSLVMLEIFKFKGVKLKLLHS